ncbi:MAG: SGNH/GDSL hydrolase family protein [Planctomycetota bacterium]|nr:SGNH/GDSL hydrolase family protein [Planctomycetota bacterium]
MLRVQSLIVLAASLLFQFDSLAGERLDHSQATPEANSDVLWYDVELLGIEGQGWKETNAKFDRLPAKAEGVVRRPVWSLSHHSAGMAVRFKTDATTIQARWSLTSSSLAMPHMPATGVSGLDLYVKTEAGRWRWLANGRPTTFPENQATLAQGIPAGHREYMLYLPLYNGVTSVEIGVAKASYLERLPRPADVKPIVFYGTSITQGGCASRPGMVHTAILGRRLDRPVINLGFSGNGKMEQEVADLLAELDVGVYVIDCLPNMNDDEVAARTEPLVHTLRQAHPTTPILLVEDRSYSDSFLIDSKRQRNESSRQVFRAAYERLVADGVTRLAYLEGEHLLGDDGEATVDSSHPTDLGFLRMADAFEPLLKQLLAADAKSQ